MLRWVTFAAVFGINRQKLLERFTMQIEPQKLWIDGKYVPALSGETIQTANPTTGKSLTTLARAKREDVDLAVQSARRAFEGPWSKMSSHDRTRILWKAGELIMARAEYLAKLETTDAGKLYNNTLNIDIPRTAETFFYFAGWATKIHGDTIPVRGPFLNYTLREPLGVVACIIPWNFPFLLAARKVAPALAIGNCVILKPPEEASLTSIELGKILLEAGLPEGVLNVVTGVGEEAGAALVDHPGVDKVAFTGGTNTGKIIMRAAANTLKKLSLELGGKSPNIIFADADVAQASQSALSAIFYNQGQICTAGSRLLVEASVYDRVLEDVSNGAKKLTTGDPMELSTKMGPLVSAEHRDRVVSYIDKGVADGAQQLSGGKIEGEGFFVEPVVFGGVSQDMTIAREEIFGPVLSVLRFETLEQASKLADATEFGLAAGVWTRDIGKAHSLAAKLKAGTVWINTYNNFDAASPYGGYKQSGFGRENGEEVLREYSQSKSVWVSMK
jgi:acyl-CoA reductase-like NAD-dependent aldehyde dehydrogenase